MTTTPRPLDGALTAAGTGLVGATILLSTTESRADHHLDGSTFVLGLLGMVGLLLVSAAGYVLVRDQSRRAALASFPGAVGAVGVGGMLLVGADYHDWAQWVAGLLVAVIAAVGIVVVRAVPYVVAAAVGLTGFAAKLTIHLLDRHLQGHSHLALSASLSIWLFVAFATALAWFLPGRHEVAIWLGACGLVVNVIALLALFIVGSLASAFIGGLGGGGSDVTWTIRTSDVVVTLVLVGLAVLGWVALHTVSGVAGYRVLIAVACATMPAVSAVVLSARHPSIWELVLAIIGGGLLLAVAATALRTRRDPQPSEG